MTVGLTDGLPANPGLAQSADSATENAGRQAQCDCQDGLDGGGFRGSRRRYATVVQTPCLGADIVEPESNWRI